MNKKGFTLIEFLVCIVLLGIVLVIGLYSSGDMLKTSLSSLRSVSDNEVFKAAKAYAQENNDIFDRNGNACVNIQDLIDYGYLMDMNDSEIKNKMVALRKNKMTRVIYDIEYTSNCD